MKNLKGLMSSDHKAVSAVFGIKVKIVDKLKQQKILDEILEFQQKSDSNQKIKPETLLIDFPEEIKTIPTSTNPNLSKYFY